MRHESYDEWHARQKRSARRSFLVWSIVALAFAGGLIYAFGGSA